MSTALARPTTNDKQHTLVVQEIGAFVLNPVSDQSINVASKDGLLVNGIIYPFSGTIIRHAEGWRFWAPSLNIPKLGPKQRQEALERLTVQVNAYIEAHPELMEQIAIRTWEQELDNKRYQLRQAQARIVSWQADIESSQRRIQELHEALTRQQQELEAHIAQRPEGAKVPDDAEAAS